MCIGFQNREDGQIELACAPETEAIFDQISRAHRSFKKLSDVESPSSVLYGSESDLSPTWFEKQAEMLGVQAEKIDGSHFFLFEDIHRAEKIIRSHFLRSSDE